MIAPVAAVRLSIEGKEKEVSVAVMKKMPLDNFDVLLGNDLGSTIKGPLWNPDEVKSRENVEEIQSLPECHEWKSLVADTGKTAEVAVLTRAGRKEVRKRQH